MLETAIVGGGLCGLALARHLNAAGVSCAVFEARERMGGRILSVPCGGTGMKVDLGPAWFWPESQPLMTRLVQDLSLSDFPQHDDGSALWLRDPDKKPESVQGEKLHGGARRLEGGMASLVERILEVLPRETLHLRHVLKGVYDHGDHVVLEFEHDGAQVTVAARHVVLAVPPRLAENQIRFEPPLEDELKAAMRETATWMAAHAKIVIGYDKPKWREQGFTGNGFADHEQAVIGEIYDSCDASGSAAALGGFLALSPEQRDLFQVGLPILIESQMAQFFGVAMVDGEQHYQDWAKEPFTCSETDRLTPPSPHAGVANPLLRGLLWDGRLHLGGSETSAHGMGYLEGALEAAQRIERSLLNRRALKPEPGRGDAGGGNETSLEQFRAWVGLQHDSAFTGYRYRLNLSLSRQQREQLTQRALLESVEEVFSAALARLEGLPFQTEGVAIERGRSGLTPLVQAPFGPFLKSLVEDVVAFNRTSCALSNFPWEHKLDGEYMQVILRDIAAAWQEFSRSVNTLLLVK